MDVAKIDAKHSNGDRIGNFGGVDTDVLCQKSEQEIKNYVNEVIDYSVNAKGFALGSGNSIPHYVPVGGYMAMVKAARKARGE